jgi:hypothetical protein
MHGKECPFFWAILKPIHKKTYPTPLKMRVGRQARNESAKIWQLLRGERDEIADLSTIAISTQAVDINPEERFREAAESGYMD